MANKRMMKGAPSLNPKGRPKGACNLITRTVKHVLEQTFQELQRDPTQPYALKEWAKREPTEFYKLAARLIPTELKADLNATITPNISLVVDAMTGFKGSK